MLNIFHDLRYAFRSLLKHRNFTVAALLTLALGIGIQHGHLHASVYPGLP
jgi:hypothetical protein